jgi:short-subunit dehydrogenase involved in D-alanine esterification of teichoic acids
MSGFGGKTVLITFGRSFLSLHLARLMDAAGHDVMITDGALSRHQVLLVGQENFPHATAKV